MLYGSEIIDVVIARNDYHAARMLAGCAFDAGKALREALLLGLVQRESFFLLVLFYETERGLFRYRRDGACAENVPFTEKDFRILMRRRLLLAGEVKVDIRRFVAVETEERLERYVVPVTAHFFSAFRADFVRQIEAGTDASVGYKLAVLAFRTDIVRRQGIYLGDIEHRRHERRADRPSGTDEITVADGFRDQFLRYHVQHREAVLDYRIELALQARVDYIGQRVAVDLAGAPPDYLLKLFVRTLERWRIGTLRDRPYVAAYHVGYLVGVLHYDLVGPVAEIAELVEHLAGGTKIQRRLELYVRISLPREQDLAEHAVFLVYKMRVAGGDYRLSEFVTEAQDELVYFF